MSTSRMRIAQLWDGLRPRRGPARLAGLVALFWIGSGLFHLGVFLVDGGPWSGAVSWRKPISFSISVGLLLWAVGWVLDRLGDRRTLAWVLSVTFASASTIEVGLIALQTWRGRASHFNIADADDALIFGIMGAMVGVMALVLIAILIWALIEPPVDTLTRWTVVGGMALVVAGLGFGERILTFGFRFVDEFGRVPETVLVGEAGVAKLPHAVAFHGIQLFMIATVMLSAAADLAQEKGRQLMSALVVSYSGLLLFSAIQTYGGRAPFDLSPISGAVLAASIGGALVVGRQIVNGWWRSVPARPDADLLSTG